jgi:glycosyltransferase involved in cell wall biosynthesis
MRNGLSAVLIVKNEEKLLERCLRSLELVDEIVILDTGSDDRTVEIAKSVTSKVYRCPPVEPFHFANARNMALQYAKQDWVLTIDADEICREGAIGEIRKAMWNNSRATAFTVKFIIANDGGEDPASIPKMKVFRRGYWQWEHRIHEILTPLKAACVIDLPTAVMEHLPLPEAEKAARRQQNLDLLKMSVSESPEYIRNARQLGMELFSREQYRDAVQWLELYLKSGTGGIYDRSETMVHLARCFDRSGIHEEALQKFDQAIEEAPVRRESYYYKALSLIKAGRPDLAIPVLEKCLSIPAGAKPDFHLNIDRVWTGEYPQEALDFCVKTVEEHRRAQGLQA